METKTIQKLSEILNQFEDLIRKEGLVADGQIDILEEGVIKHRFYFEELEEVSE